MDNICLGDDGFVKLVDFGSASEVRDQRHSQRIVGEFFLPFFSVSVDLYSSFRNSDRGVVVRVLVVGVA